MRRLLLAATLLVALLAIYALKPGWLARSEPRRSADATEAPAGSERSTSGASGTGASASDAAAEDARARVHGVVTGPEGPLWCARVIAYRQDTDHVLAEAFTNPRGEYTLPVEASDFQIAVEPAAGVWLVPPPRRGVVLNTGDDIEENFTLAAKALLFGRVVDKDGQGVPDVVVLAVPAEHAGPADAHPNAVADHIAAKCRTGRDGGFRLGGIAAGTYSLVIGEPSLMLTFPVVAQTDGPELALTVVPAIAVDLAVTDVETGDPVDAFSVKVRGEGRTFIDGRGSRGVFSRRVPVESPRDPRAGSPGRVEIAAAGFADWGPHAVTDRARQPVRLIPRRDPNTTIRVSFDDGRPYHGSVRLLFSRRNEPAPYARSLAVDQHGSMLALERVEDGVYRGAMPHGRWWLAMVPEDVPGGPELRREIELGPGRGAEAAFVLPAGGELLLVPARGAPACSVCIQAVVDPEGRSRSTVFEIPPEGRRIEGILPGRYRLGYPKIVAYIGREAVSTHTVIWFRDVHVVAGGSEQIDLPSP